MTADVGGKAAISVVLLPNATDTKALIECSQAINADTKSVVTLGDPAIPHITLAQFFAAASELDNLWESVKHLQGQVTEATSTGLCFLPEQTRDNIWLELSFFQSIKLMELRNAILASQFAQQFEVNNGDPDRFRPHVTLAMYPGKKTLSTDLSQFSVFRHTYQELRLAVGVNGPNLSLIKINLR